MAQQTAVEWFHIEFQKRFPKETTEMYNNNQLGYEDLIQKAKEMEKQQREISQMDMFYYINHRNFGDGYIQRRDEAKKYIEQYTTKNI
jgi:hypothetical protein